MCTLFSHRTHNETHSQTQRNTPVIYLTTATHSVSNIQQENQTEFTFTDANTRDKLPEASPKGPGPTHLRALAGQRSKNIMRTLVTQGLASRSPKPDNQQTSPENTTPENKQLTAPPLPYKTLIKKTNFRHAEFSTQVIHKKRRRQPYTMFEGGVPAYPHSPIPSIAIKFISKIKLYSTLIIQTR